MSEKELPFCMCCGRTRKYIQGKLTAKPWVDGKRSWKGHVQHEGRDYFYDENTVGFCEKCGLPLSEDSIQGANEFMGMVGMSRASQYIVSGYKCKNCGTEIKF